MFLDIETTSPVSFTSVWQVAYAKALQEGQTLKVLEVTELVGKDCIMSEEVRQALEWAERLVAYDIKFVLEFLEHRELPVPQDSYCTVSEVMSVCKVTPSMLGRMMALEMAIAVLGLANQLNSMVGDLPYHDAFHDVYAVMLLYCKLNDLQLEMDNCKITKASLVDKYNAVLGAIRGFHFFRV